MNDLISRSSALRILWGKIKDVARNKDGTYKLRDGAFVDGLFRAVDVISHIEPAVRWIPVSERSPERLPEAAGLEVLVTAVNGFEQKTVFKAFMGYGDFKWYTSDALIQPDKNNVVPEHWKIIAWMPLPEPYQEANHE